MLKAIETRYKGYRFRSRLEARWGVFFDALPTPWEYEVEGFRFGSKCYLPDFWLPKMGGRRVGEELVKCGSWVEIKPAPPTEEECSLCRLLARETERIAHIFVGTPGNQNGHSIMFLPTGQEYTGSRLVGCEHGKFHSLGLIFTNPPKSAPVCSRCGNEKREDSPFLLRAYEAARGARFEHGETPEFSVVEEG